MYACGEATNGRLGLGVSSGTVPVPRQVTALSSYVVKKVAVHSGTARPALARRSGSARGSCSASNRGPYTVSSKASPCPSAVPRGY